MNQNKKTLLNLGVIIGVLGTISGIILLYMGNYILGICGGIASASVAYKSYRDRMS